MPDETLDWEGEAFRLQQSQLAPQVANSVRNATDVNPDQAARANVLSRQLMIPATSILSDPKAAEVRARMAALDAPKLIEQAPVTATTMANQQNANAAQDDIPTLAGIEATVRGSTSRKDAISTPELQDLGALAIEPIKGFGGAFHSLGEFLTTAAGAGPVAYDKLASLLSGKLETGATDAYFRTQVDPILRERAAFAPAPETGFAGRALNLAGNMAGVLDQAFLTGGEGAALPASASGLEAVQAAAAHGTKAMVLPALSGAVNTGRDVYQATGDASAATRAAVTQYAATTAGGIVPLAAPGGLATRLVTGAGSGMLTGEGSRQAMNLALPQGMQQPFDPEELILSGLAGSILSIGGPRAPEPAVHDAIRQTYQSALTAEQSASDTARIAQLSELAVASKWRQRDPEAFHAFVERASENGDLPAVYVDPNVLAQAMDKAGTPAQELRQVMPEVAGQMKAALETGADVRIPTADYVTHIAGGPLDADLLPHLKADPEGMTAAQVEGFYQNAKAEMAAAAPEVVAQEGKRASSRAVFDDILRQVTDTGRFSPDVARNYAALHQSFFDTLADRTGAPVEELYRQLGPQVVGEPLAGALSQDNRGAYRPEDRAIGLTNSADLSTFLHESGHYFLDTLSRVAARPDAPAGVREDMGTLLKHFGVSDLATWQKMSLEEQRPHHEAFAQGFERYLMEGKAPSIELGRVFARFRAWLTQVYQRITGLGAPVDPEVRAVMDRMLASDDAIRAAQASRKFQMPFRDAQEAAAAGITPEAYAELEQAHQEATQASIEDLTGRSLRDMRWLANARSRALKAAQAEAASTRRSVREQVEAEIAKDPIEQARTWLTRGEMTTPEGEEVKAMKGFKLDPEGLRELYPEGMANRPDLASIRHLTEKNGLHPDQVAEMFGLRSGDQLVRELIDGPTRDAKVEAATDQRMLEEHGELSSPADIERAANEAVHNEARGRFAATALKVLNKAPGDARALLAGAKEAAQALVAQTKVSDLDVRRWMAAEGRANAQAIKLAARDPVGAVRAQRQALLANQVVRATMAAREEVESIRKYMRKFDNEGVRERLPGEFVQQIDALRDQFDFRKSATTDPNARAKQDLASWAQGLRDAGYEPQIAEWLAAFKDRTHYTDVKLEQLRGLYDTVRSIEATGRSFREVTRNGEKVELNGAVADLVATMAERGEKFSREELVNPPNAETDGTWKTLLYKLGTGLRISDAFLRPHEYKFNEFDLHKIDGPFRQLILAPIFAANYRKVDMTKAVSDAAQKTGEELGREWQDSLNTLVDNRTLVDRRIDPSGRTLMKITRAKMLGIARHVGNENNFARLTEGYGWDPGQVWNFLNDHMTAKDWRATQAHWDVFEPLWEQTEAMIRRLGGVPPPKIPAREFETPFGKMRGGYSPLDYDPVASKLSARKGQFDLDPSERVEGEGKLYRATTTRNGSLNARREGYTDFVNLDVRSADARIRDTIHDLAYREALLDATKIINHRGFRDAFAQTYGKEELQALTTWLKSVRDQYLIDPTTRPLEKVLQYARQGVVTTGVAYRLTTVLKHGSAAALKSLGYLGNAEGAGYFASRTVRMFSGHMGEEIAAAKEKFPEIRARMLQIDRDYKEGPRSMYEPEGWRAKNDRFGHAFVAWSDALSAIPTAWAAYDLARMKGVPVEQGGTGKPMSEEEAVRYANSVVRQAHGSALETARSNFMHLHGWWQLFGTIYGFMNNTYGQQRDIYSKAFGGGAFTDNPALIGRQMATVIVPALIAGWVSEGLPGTKDLKGWMAWAAKSITGEVAAMVPFVRDAWAVLVHDHADQAVAPSRLIADAVKSGKDIGAELEGKHAPIIQDMANAVGEWFHIGGLGQAGKIAQYLEDVRTGRKHPDGPVAAAKGATIGEPAKK